MSAKLSYVKQFGEVRVRREGQRVLVIEDAELRLDLPPEAALQIGRALIAKARECEEENQAERIALDHALLLRLGSKIGLTNRPDIQRIAAIEAAWNRDLRRYLPGGVRASAQIGTPTIEQRFPRKKVK